MTSETPKIEATPTTAAAYIAPTTSLKRRTAIGTIWFVFQYGAARSLRLVSNLILTRLLTPEIFGLAAIVSALMQGITMFTDIGVRGKMIEDKRSNEPFFYNTIWTYGFIRSWVLFAILCLIAYPVSLAYGEPDLLWVIPIVATTLIFTSFSTNAMALLSRNLEMKKPVIVTVAIRVLVLIVMASWAFFDPSIRAIVAGMVVGAIAKMISSYFILPGFRNRFCWYPEVMRSVVRYGRWVLLSTGARYFMAQGDRMLLGLFLLQSDLGIYAIAILLADAGVDFVRGMSTSLLQAVYARLNDKGIEPLRRRMIQIRWMILGCALPAMAIPAIFGPLIVEILYDPRYAEAGWMLQILAVAGGVEILLITSTTAMLSRGDSFRFMIFQVTRGCIVIVALLGGYYLAGLFGVLVGRLIANFVGYPLAAWGLSRQGLWMPLQDLTAIIGFVTLVLGGLWLMS